MNECRSPRAGDWVPASAGTTAVDRVEMVLGCGMMRTERLRPILTSHGSHYRLYDPTGAVGAGPAV